MVEDHGLVREGLAVLIRQRTDMCLVGEAADGLQAVKMFRSLRPDVTIMDLGLPVLDGMSAIRIILEEQRDARILVLTMRHGDEDVRQALSAGARGYLLKDASWEEISQAIIAVHQGLRRVAPRAAAALAESLGDPCLTRREQQIVEYMVELGSNKEIGEKLGISEATVKVHVTRILGKLEVDARTPAVTSALRRGIIHLK